MKIGDVEPAAGSNFFEGLVEELEYARIRGVSIRTCQRDRHLRISPPFIKLGRRIFYRVEAVRDWLLKHEIKETVSASFPRRYERER